MVSIRTQAPRSTEGFPASAHVGSISAIPWRYSPPNCYQAPQDSFVQCVVLSPLLLQQFKQDSSFQFSEMETSACNFENPCQGPLFCCFDWLSLTCKQNPQRSSKRKDPARQTSAFHKGRLFMHSHPLWNEEPEFENNKFISPSPKERVLKSRGPLNLATLTHTHTGYRGDKSLTALSFPKSLV